jgi:hypothetical protein
MTGPSRTTSCFPASNTSGPASFICSPERRAGLFLDGGNNNRLTVPANVRVKQYWSAVVYDRASHTFICDLSRF